MSKRSVSEVRSKYQGIYGAPRWLYLAVVTDLFARKIVGWSAKSTIQRDLVLDAVLMAARRRKPRGTF